MAYNFKNLADVELLNAMPEGANVVVEVGGKTKRAPQVQIPEPVDEIALIVNSETLEEVPEGATVLAEVNGEIKRIPSNQVGGIDAIVFSVIEAATAAIETPTYQTVCNHTLEEVRNLMLAGAGCVLIMPPPAGATASTLKAGGTTPTPTPTVITVSAIAGGQMSDGSAQFTFMSEDGARTITYNADGTITNSLLSA